MENKGVLIGSIIFVFGSFILMIGMMLWESNKAYKMKELAQSVKTESSAGGEQRFPRRTTRCTRPKWAMKAAKWFKSRKGRSRWAARTAIPTKLPEHQVFLKGFFLDRKEVTQEEYTRFAKMTKRQAPRIEVFEDDQSKLLKPEFAAMSVSWDDALAYCRWAGKRLPTEAEWEKAGRGEGKRRYPWGDKFITNGANVDGSEDGYKYLAPPGSFDAGRSPYGLYDMTGNVAEWVNDTYDESYYKKSPYRDPKGSGRRKRSARRSWRIVAGDRA